LTPTAKQVRESHEREALIASLDPETQDRIAAGEVEIRGTGEKGKLILVDSKTKKYVKGTDRPEGSPDMAKVGRATAFMKTNDYREAWQSMFNLAGEEGVVGFETLMEKLWWAVNGAEQLVECPHDGCGKRHVYAFKPDPKTMFQMVQSHIGSLPKQVEHSGGVQHVHELLQSDEDDDEKIEVWSVNPQDPEAEAERRKKFLLEAGAIEEDWFGDGGNIVEGQYTEVPE
jgi:hypothetical protein